MGAMENTGLNIFNSRYVLSSPETATDADDDNIGRIVAQASFHNWTGNRITCRDGFQRYLKEGLTDLRDEQFSADARSAARRSTAFETWRRHDPTRQSRDPAEMAGRMLEE
ncbi:MAG: hypothetical protein JJT88_15715 [Gammaproteobacteria bacterium]|nr:hypothetical protein [Gammaproteobacteria bacterium]